MKNPYLQPQEDNDDDEFYTKYMENQQNLNKKISVQWKLIVLIISVLVLLIILEFCGDKHNANYEHHMLIKQKILNA